MSNEMIVHFENMLSSHEKHLAKLKRWKDLGGTLQNYPEGETIEDFISREETAIENLQRAIRYLQQSQ